ncbi:transposase zinc-binding domain-containing protein, partial [Myxococcota bacterium]|nr:transposase zinc-binding domain-containing protein [Myxococcota bacterium]
MLDLHSDGIQVGRPVFITPEPIQPHQRAVHGSTGPALHYERTPGDALRPLPATYRRREPEKTALHSLVHEHMETLLAQARQASVDGSGYPAFVEKEFRRYLDCGILANGFARLRCPTCGFERLVAFSCKGRLCPSCWAKRAADTAAHLVDHVLPEATYRQWVLTFPWEARLFVAIDRQLLSDLLRDFLRTVFAWQRRRGRLAGLTDGHCGAVTFVQRFGGALNTNPHFHVLIPDG